MALIKRISLLSGIEHEMEIESVSQAEVEAWLDSPRGRRPMVQEHFRRCTVDQREFILTGITPEEWEIFENRGMSG
jgi:hypothetical protein